MQKFLLLQICLSHTLPVIFFLAELKCCIYLLQVDFHEHSLSFFHHFFPLSLIVLHYTLFPPWRIFSGMCATNGLWEREREWGRCGYCCQLSNACLNKPPGGCANKDYSKHLSSSLKTHTQCTAAYNTKQMYICWRVASWICLESIWICGCIKLNSSVIPLHWTITVFWSAAD